MNTLAAIHVAKKQLGLDDDTYRDAIEAITGKRSAADMTEAEHRMVIEEFRRRGFKGPSRAGTPALGGRFTGKLRALWIAAWNLGIVRDRRDSALIAFARRQTGIDHVRFLRYGDDAARVIEALKSWMAREASVDWDPSRKVPAAARIIEAQWRLLERASALPQPRVEIWLADAMGVHRDHRKLTREEAIEVMNALGRLVRAAGTGGAPCR